jgi:putative flippase GtrA
MTVNSFRGNTLESAENREKKAQSRQAIDMSSVTAADEVEMAEKNGSFSRRDWIKPHSHMEIQNIPGLRGGQNSGNSFGLSVLSARERGPGGKNSRKKSAEPIRGLTLARWLKFNFVGGIGIGVQFVALFLLKSVLHVNYLAATAWAVETAVVHNFVWHEQFTWADRITTDRLTADRGRGTATSGAKARNLRIAWFAALKRCATQNPWVKRSAPESQNRAFRGPRRCATKKPWPSSLTRFVRFNLTTGAVSIVGNLALMKVMVGLGHINYLVANIIAIALCSVANFVVSDEWVFGGKSEVRSQK